MTDSGCQQCEENTFSGPGASSCTSCPEGKLSAAGSALSDDCEYGKKMIKCKTILSASLSSNIHFICPYFDHNPLSGIILILYYI